VLRRIDAALVPKRALSFAFQDQQPLALLLTEAECLHDEVLRSPRVRCLDGAEMCARERRIETRQRLSLPAADFFLGDFIPLEITTAEADCESTLHPLSTQLGHFGRRQLIRLTPSVRNPGHLPRVVGVFLYASHLRLLRIEGR